MTATLDKSLIVSLECDWARNIRTLAHAAKVTPATVLHSAAQILFERYKGVDSDLDLNKQLSFSDVLASPDPIFKELPSIRVEWGKGTAGAVDSQYLLHVIETLAGDVLLSWHYPESSVLNNLLSNRLPEHFGILLKGLVTYADTSVWSIPFLTAGEIEKVIQWNTTGTDYPRDALIHELFEHWTAETPEAVAITCEGNSITYEHVNARANQLAHHLIECGVGHESVVGIALERSIEMVISMIAVLKAGGCYLPLDATYPHERLRFMMQDSGTAVLITRGGLRSAFEGLAIKTIDIEGDRDTLAGYSVQNILRQESASANSLAYVMYTSGSTGVPKGVEVMHRGVVRLVKNSNYIHLDRTDTVAQISKFSFDAITFEVWGALLNGGRLAILPHDVILSPTKLADAIRERRVTAMFLTAALFNMVAKTKPDAFAGVRNLLAGGDVVSPESVRRVMSIAPPGRLINGYGPTECTTFSCCHHISNDTNGASGVPIGRPISNSEAYLLDRSLLPVPVGVIGEIYLGGDGLARGYRNRPELTAERFVPHCIHPETGDRLYKTGDKGRYRANGVIEFLGRTDNQVKLRGHRIELGEIEAALCKHPEVSASVVLAVTRENGEPFLCGYVEKRSEHDLNGEELRRFLAEMLPAFMIPSRIAVLDTFPLTPVGKIDRNLLQSLRPEPKEKITALPGNEIEKQIANAWSRVLAVSEVGLDENFFDMGGSSLLMAILETDLQNKFKFEITITDLFQYATVRSLAAFVGGKTGKSNSFGQIQQRAQRQKQMFHKLRKQSAL